MTIALALTAAVLWGVSDFSGGKVSRGRSTLVVALVSQAAGFLLVGLVAAVTGSWTTSTAVVAWGVAAGISLSATVLLFYRALAIGSMSVVAPIAATGVVVPVVAGLASGDVPSALALVGIVVAVLGVTAAAKTPTSGTPAPDHARSVVLAVGAAVGFGLLQLTTAGGAARSPLTTMVVMRATTTVVLTTVLLLVLTSSRTVVRRPESRPVVVAMVLVGLVDVSANSVFAFASTADDLPVVAVLSALYPAVTVLLARVVDRERLGRLQQTGVVAAFAGVVMIALG